MGRVDFSFDRIFEKASSAWPLELSMELIFLDHVVSDRYLVKGLGALSEDVISKCLGSEDEPFIRSMHECIVRGIMASAKYVLSVRVRELRREFLKPIFNAELLKIKNSNGMGWTEKGKKNIELYFGLNK